MRYSYEFKRKCAEMYRSGQWPETPEGSKEKNFKDMVRQGIPGGNCQGSGLGLYICRQLMNAMGGEIFAEKKDLKMEVSLVLSKA